MQTYKPHNYKSLSPYLIADDAPGLVDQLVSIFDAKILRRYDHEDGKIAHIELQIDDSVLMLSNSTEDYAATKSLLHLYVPDVMETFEKAIAQGCEAIERPVRKQGDPDTRGSFYDLAGNYWAVSTQADDR